MLIKEVRSQAVTAYGPPPTVEEIGRFKGSNSAAGGADGGEGACALCSAACGLQGCCFVR